VATLERLRDQGVSIAIDDFGTGYNTLSYLKSYPVSCIKIDRAFVKDAENDQYSRAICRSVAALGDSLDMNVIGEGVETLGQAEFLRAIGCRELQGYHFGQPVSAWDFMTTYGKEGVWVS
jgi:EAL domain-containing protein (putative c-di-GMP-specific phosphodiesterase class I)